MLRSTLCTFAFATIVLGCTENKEPAPDTLGGGSQEQGCAAGATQSVEGGFCLALPSDHQGGATAGSDGQRRFDYSAGASSVVVTSKTGANATDAEWASATKNLAEQATILGGSSRTSGASISGTWKETDGRTTATKLLRGDGKIVECRATSSSAPALQACESLRLL
jgi:hypothetical protein